MKHYDPSGLVHYVSSNDYRTACGAANVYFAQIRNPVTCLCCLALVHRCASIDWRLAWQFDPDYAEALCSQES